MQNKNHKEIIIDIEAFLENFPDFTTKVILSHLTDNEVKVYDKLE